MALKHFEIANVLLRNHANPDGGDPKFKYFWTLPLSFPGHRGCTRPVNWAIRHREFPAINQLIDAGTDLNIPNGRCKATSHGPSASHPLCTAIEIANHTIIDLLLSKGAVITNGRCCALSTAAKKNEFSLFKRLHGEIPSRYDPKDVFLDAFSLNSDENYTRNQIELMRSSSIHFSADVCGWLLSDYHQSSAKVEFLLKNGANPNTMVAGSRTITRNTTIIGYSTPLIDAIQGCRAQDVDLLLEHGADVNLVSPGKICGSPLFAAMKIGNMGLFRRLLELGAQPNKSIWVYNGGNVCCWNLLHHAVAESNLEMVNLLLEYGADPSSQRDAQEYTGSAVKWFSKELSKQHATEDWPERLSPYRWMMLARCFYLANDIHNARIALEQVFLDYEGDGEFVLAIACGMCGFRRLRHLRHHLCKDGDRFGICEDCIGKRERQLKSAGALDTHEFLTYPRPFFSTIPKGFVALSETEFIPREDWLESIGANWSFDSVEAQSC